MRPFDEQQVAHPHTLDYKRYQQITPIEAEMEGEPGRALPTFLRWLGLFGFIVMLMVLSAFGGAMVQQHYSILGPENNTLGIVVQVTPTAKTSDLKVQSATTTATAVAEPTPTIVNNDVNNDKITVTPTATVPVANSNIPPDDQKLFDEAWAITSNNYVDKKALNDHKMTYGAISGMLNSLGDRGHTRFLTPDDMAKEESSLSGTFEGIGATLSDRDGIPTIVSPIDGAPAQKAGLKPGDQILAVDGVRSEGQTLDELISKVRGPKGTKVTLTIRHRGDTVTQDITITRDIINVPSVEWRVLTSQNGTGKGKTIGYIKFTEFSANADKEMTKALTDIMAQHPDGLIIDVRDNPGGLVDEVTLTSSHFLSSGSTIFLSQDREGHRQNSNVRAVTPVVTDIPMVVLTNEGTASAAEIFSGAMQDNKRAKIVGSKTFGTGTVLEQFPLSDGSAIFLGVNEWLTPNGRFIREGGLTPDELVAMPNNRDVLSPTDITAAYSQGLSTLTDKDPQLGKGLEDLLK